MAAGHDHQWAQTRVFDEAKSGRTCEDRSVIEHRFDVKLGFNALFQEKLADIATRCRSQRIAGGAEAGAARSVALTTDRDRVT
jgi:hypothetical protein